MSRKIYVFDKTTGKMVEKGTDSSVSGTVINRDKLFADGVKSPQDGSFYDTRREWDEHLKRNGLVEYGNDRIERPSAEPASAIDDIRRAIGELNG